LIGASPYGSIWRSVGWSDLVQETAAMPENRDPNQYVRQMDYQITTDGRTVALNFRLANESKVDLQFAYESLSGVVRAIEEAMGRAFEQQREDMRGMDPRLMYPISARQVTKIEGGFAIDGRTIITFVFRTGSRMDIGLDEIALQQLTRWVNQLQENSIRGRTPKLN
jgi:hypothetical protein